METERASGKSKGMGLEKPLTSEYFAGTTRRLPACAVRPL
jgi:hypothetical protein